MNILKRIWSKSDVKDVSGSKSTKRKNKQSGGKNEPEFKVKWRGLMEMPNELFVEIFSFLEGRFCFHNVGLVCHGFHGIIEQSSHLHKSFVKNECHQSVEEDVNYFHVYRESFSLKFDPDHKSSELLKIENNGKELKTPGNWSNTFEMCLLKGNRISMGLRRFYFLITGYDTGSFYIGITTLKDSKMDNLFITRHKNTYYFNPHDGLKHNDSKSSPYVNITPWNQKVFHVDDIVCMIVDMNTGSLSYEINGKPLGVCFSGIKVKPVIPMVILRNSKQSLKLLNVSEALELIKKKKNPVEDNN